MIEGPAVDDSVYHSGVVRHPHISASTGDQRSSNQVQGLKLDSMAQEEANMGLSSECCTQDTDGKFGTWNYGGRGGTKAVTSALVTSGK